MVVHGHNMNELWVTLLDKLLVNGKEVAPRAQRTREVIPLTLVLLDPLKNIVTIPERNLNYSFMVAEWLWIMAARDDVPSIAFYNKEIARFSDDGERYFGAYGPKIVGQSTYIINKLKEDPSSRQAVLTIWRENPPGTRDVPCTIAMQFLLRDKLTLIVTMRSSDAWLGVPYDLFNFSRVLSWFAKQLEVEADELVVHLGSSHIYEQHFNAAHALTEKYIDDAYFEDPYDRLPIGASPALTVAPGVSFIRNLEERARLRGEVLPDANEWTDYAEALVYRYHLKAGAGGTYAGDGHIMKIIRAVKALREDLPGDAP
jgi:thymidylate synthase